MTNDTMLPMFAEQTPAKRLTMNGKPVYAVPAKTAINFTSGFAHKLLCDGLTFSTGSACCYTCSFCYVPDLMQKSPHMHGVKEPHHDVVIRRTNSVAAAVQQLTDRHGKPKFANPLDTRVIYASPLVDVAGNMDLVRETIEVCQAILRLTNWQIRLLTKSNLMPKIAQALEGHRARMIYGVSTGTLNDRLAHAFEEGTPLVSKRIQSLHWLQDNGFRTYGMICPSLPQTDYTAYAREMRDAIRADKCEHVWGEVINVRGDSMTRTCAALSNAGYHADAKAVETVSRDKTAWETYARATFEAHAPLYRPGQLRFLQYATAATRDWWQSRVDQGAILL